MKLEAGTDPASGAVRTTSRRRLIALCVAAAAVVAGAALRQAPQKAAPVEQPFEAVMQIVEDVSLTPPPPMRAEDLLFARRVRGGRWVIAASGTVAVCSPSGSRVLFTPSPTDPAGIPAVDDDGTIHVPFPGRIETFGPDGEHRGTRPWQPPAHALCVRDYALAAAGLDARGRLVHVVEPVRDHFAPGMDEEVAKRFHACLDADSEGTLWAIHPARYALFGLTARGREVRIDGVSPAYRPLSRFTGPPTPRAIRAWTEGAWILETVVAIERGAAVSIRGSGRRRVEILGRGAPIAFAAGGRRLVGRDEGRRLVFAPESASGSAFPLEIARFRGSGPSSGPLPVRGPVLLVFVSSRDCPACLSILAAVEAIAAEHGPHGLDVRAVVGAEDPVARRIAAIEAPRLSIVSDEHDAARRRLGIRVGPALRLLDGDGMIVLALDGAEPAEAGPVLRAAVLRVCPCSRNRCSRNRAFSMTAP